MTQNIEQRTLAATATMEGAAKAVDEIANTDKDVTTPVGTRKSFPKISREWDEKSTELKTAWENDSATLRQDWQNERNELSTKALGVKPWESGVSETNINQQRRWDDGHTYLPKAVPAVMDAGGPNDDWIPYTADKSATLNDVFGRKPVDLFSGLVLVPDASQNYPKLNALGKVWELHDNDQQLTVKSYSETVDNHLIITLDDNSNVIAYKMDGASREWTDNNFSRTFNTVIDMKRFPAKQGSVYQTRGYYFIGDGGGDMYNIIVGSEFDNKMIHDMGNGLIAVPCPKALPSLLQAGGKPDGNPLANTGTDNSDAIDALVDYCAKYGGSPYAPAGNYRKTRPIKWKLSTRSTFVAKGNGMRFVGDGRLLSIIFGSGEDGIDVSESNGQFEAIDIGFAGKGSMGTNPATGFANLPTGVGIINNHPDASRRNIQTRLTRVGIYRFHRVSQGSRGNWLCYMDDCDFAFSTIGPDFEGPYATVVTNSNFICKTVVECQNTYIVRAFFAYNHVSLGTWSAIFGEPEQTLNANIGQFEYIGNYHETYERMGQGSVVLDLRFMHNSSLKFEDNYFSIGKTSFENMTAFRRLGGYGGLTSITSKAEFKRNVYSVAPDVPLYQKSFVFDADAGYQVQYQADDIINHDRGVKDSKIVTAFNNQVLKALVTLKVKSGMTLSFLDFLSDKSATLRDGRIIDADGDLLLHSTGRYKLSFYNVRNTTLPAGRKLYIDVNSIISNGKLLIADDDVYSQKAASCILHASFPTDVSIAINEVGGLDYERDIDLMVELERVQ